MFKVRLKDIFEILEQPKGYFVVGFSGYGPLLQACLGVLILFVFIFIKGFEMTDEADA